MNEMLSSGIELMLLGMGMVYAFLAMLIVAIHVMSRLVRRYFPEMPAKFSDQAIVAGNDKAVIAAITAAVHQYRKKHNHG
jgi:oxaloacetate decarboxylase (Na+ extruding) subunit gamma